VKPSRFTAQPVTAGDRLCFLFLTGCGRGSDSDRVKLSPFAHPPGAMVQVRRLDGPQVYPVPPEIPDGAVVKVISFEPGSYRVEFSGREYTLSMTCLAPFDGRLNRP